MSDSPSIPGIPDPRRQIDGPKGKETDPEKFKKVMKVDQSEETSKRDPRQRAKKQEEEDSENEETVSSQKPSGTFSGFLDEGGPSNNILAPGEGTAASFTLSDDHEEVAPFTLLSGLQPDKPQKSKKLDEEQNITPNITIKSDKKEQKEPHKKNQLAPKQVPHLIKEEKTPPHETVSFHEKDKKIDPAKIEPSLKPKEDLKKEEEVSETIVPLATAPHEKELTPTKKVEKTPEDTVKETLKGALQTDSSMKEESDKKEDHEKHKEDDNAVNPFTPLLTPPPQGILPTEAPAYTKLSTETFELFERMVGLMIFESKKGVNITTVQLSMPGSVFNKCEIRLEHYDTAPHAFNVQLIGNPKAVELFDANLPALAKSLDEAKLPFQVNLIKPVLSRDDTRHLIKRKGAASGDSQGESSKDK